MSADLEADLHQLISQHAAAEGTSELAASQQIIEAMPAIQQDLVNIARAAGVTWREVGEATGRGATVAHTFFGREATKPEGMSASAAATQFSVHRETIRKHPERFGLTVIGEGRTRRYVAGNGVSEGGQLADSVPVAG